MFCNIPLLRYVLLREQIDIVHGHSAFSALAHEAMYVGKLLGLRVIELHLCAWLIDLFNFNFFRFILDGVHRSQVRWSMALTLFIRFV